MTLKDNWNNYWSFHFSRMSQEEEDYTGEEEQKEEEHMSEEQKAHLIEMITKDIDSGLINLDDLLDKENLKNMLEKIKSFIELLSNHMEIREELKNPKEHPEHIFALCRLIYFLIDFDENSKLGMGIIYYLCFSINGPQNKSKSE